MLCTIIFVIGETNKALVTDNGKTGEEEGEGKVTSSSE